MPDAKWKPALLRTGLPFEYFVSKALEAKGFDVSGEFAFTRKERDGTNVECSVDLKAEHLIGERAENGNWQKAVQLNLLVECKYNVPGSHWVLAPRPREILSLGREEMVLVDQCSCGFVENRSVVLLPEQTPICLKGVVLHEGAGDAQDHTIQHGLSQLRYAMPRLVASALSEQLGGGEEYGMPLFLLGSLLVTSAPIRVLKPELSMETYNAAQGLDDISTVVPYVCVSNPLGPDLRAAVTDSYEQWTSKEKGFKDRTSARTMTIRRAGMRVPRNNTIGALFRRAATRVIVVNFDNLSAVLDLLLLMSAQMLHECVITGRVDEETDVYMPILPPVTAAKLGPADARDDSR